MDLICDLESEMGKTAESGKGNKWGRTRALLWDEEGDYRCQGSQSPAPHFTDEETEGQGGHSAP